ncbi:hypothetical protein ISG33_14260 [Glaciecola sp. MH2013]|uniref:hypothetical protein n=1 Tax=Glaciecola sp. MH2013 TaxID=2785524 RepID=UPI00189EBFB4|nr:hypothetical protein [Glaciecola sp. MH2013]MBF7074565.1 hypothetical protein [Glaciecola sp. MH2013]
MKVEKGSQDAEQDKLSIPIRMLIGLASLPSMALAFMLVSAIIDGQAAGIGAFETLYALVGFIAFYVALSGKKLF